MTPDITAPVKRAVLYLRVSSEGQVKTDYDPEGISIPAQREVCERKAAALGIEVVGEYVEAGKSATTVENRLVFKQMLERIRTDRDVEYVIVYKLSRMNRNRVQDALVVDRLRRNGVSLISATEAIDESRNGQLLHGILAAINEFRSAEDGADIRDKMGYKARAGGTIGRAPVGYRNARQEFDGRQINTVVTDEERAELVRTAFQLYATGEYSMERLQQSVAESGLTTRHSGRWDSSPISANMLHKMLRNPYYIGKISYEGERYDGRHDALISEALFNHVQDVLDARSENGKRDRQLYHYLKGCLYCQRCHAEGREARLIYTEAKGNGGIYQYYVCVNRQGGCRLPYIAVHRIEAAIAAEYQHLRLDQRFTSDITARMDDAMAREQDLQVAMERSLRHQRRTLDTKIERLLDLATDGSLPRQTIRDRVNRLTRERADIDAALQLNTDQLNDGIAAVRAAIELMSHPEDSYALAGPATRRTFNETFYAKFYIDEAHGVEVADRALHPPFDEILEAAEAFAHAGGRQLATVGAQQRKSPGNTAGATPENGRGRLADLYQVNGSNKTVMVEVRGFEPLASSVRGKRSTGLSYTPEWDFRLTQPSPRSAADRPAALSIAEPVRRRVAGQRVVVLLRPLVHDAGSRSRRDIGR